MTESLDKILSGAGEALPAPEKTETVTEQPTAPPQDAAPAEQPEQGEQQGGGEQANVPIAALHAERQKTKRYTEQLGEVEKKLAEQNDAWERRFNQLLQAVKPQVPQQPAQPQQAPDWYENPNAAALHAVAPELAQVQKQLLAVAKDSAISRFTEAKVDEAEKAFIRAYETGALDPADYQKVIASPNRYAAAVQWHQRQQALTEIGDDPSAYKERVRAELLKELEAKQADPGQQQQQPAPVMPSNLVGARNVGARTGPAWSGPKDLKDIFAWRQQQP